MRCRTRCARSGRCSARTGSEVSPADRVVVVDARGLRCPLPVIRLAQVVRGLASGSVVVLQATDPAAAYDVPAWCRLRGHQWLGRSDVGPGTAMELRVRVQSP